MPTLLSIESSPRGEYSVSRALTAKFIEEWKKDHTGGTVVTRDLMKTELPFVDVPWIAGAYTPAEKHSPEMQKALQISNTLIAELKAADHIILGTSMYNFSIPANLKAYIDHICRINETFNASYEGLVTGKKMTIILASGSVYTPDSPTAGYNRASDYLKQIFGFIGIKDLTLLLAGGSGGVDRGVTKREDLLAQHEPAVLAAAR